MRLAVSACQERTFVLQWGVPRVSEAHLAARRQQILDAARTCFLRNGFHQTSMQDVISEAGLSVGAVYRYFPSKNDLITALAEQVIDADRRPASTSSSRQDPPPPLADAMQRATDLVTARDRTGRDAAAGPADLERGPA